MDYLNAEQAVYWAAAGLLGLALGWWLGRSGARKAAERVVGELRERLDSSDFALEETSQEVQRLAGQVSELNIDAEESRDRSVSLAANLGESERKLAGERERAGELQSRLEARDSTVAAIESDISKQQQEVETLQKELLVAQEDVQRLEDDLDRERDQSAEHDHAIARYERRIAALESAISTRRREEDGLRGQLAELRGQSAGLREELDRSVEESERLRAVKLEFQEWMQGAARREEELLHARRQLETVGDERATLATETAALRSALDEVRLEADGLRGELEQARREASSAQGALDAARHEADSVRSDLDEALSQSQVHEAKAAAAEGDREQLSEELAGARERVRELEADEALASRLAAEIEGLHSELAAGAERERELTHRAQVAETAHTQAAEELETLLNAPLVDVDRLASSRAGTLTEDDGAPSGETAGDGPELLEAPRGAADDLKRIRGIGPVLETLLNRLGVYHFRQIASWTSEEISWVASHVNTFPDRIERDGWTTQAAALDRGEAPGEEE